MDARYRCVLTVALVRLDYGLNFYRSLDRSLPATAALRYVEKTTQNGFIDFQLVSTELYRSG